MPELHHCYCKQDNESLVEATEQLILLFNLEDLLNFDEICPRTSSKN